MVPTRAPSATRLLSGADDNLRIKSPAAAAWEAAQAAAAAAGSAVEAAATRDRAGCRLLRPRLGPLGRSAHGRCKRAISRQWHGLPTPPRTLPGGATPSRVGPRWRLDRDARRR